MLLQSRVQPTSMFAHFLVGRRGGLHRGGGGPGGGGGRVPVALPFAPSHHRFPSSPSEL
ncbi:hypothetical protein E2C01_068960 [Portunus trituberculatus]|uniref:Uncharacterized protein n=1 Tax=Portunus trituberculatus TaxID=210409 RepID=A0A5B7HXC2_PORTR|nr:hypothetical protein [Portunus trituberculatus]